MTLLQVAMRLLHLANGETDRDREVTALEVLGPHEIRVQVEGGGVTYLTPSSMRASTTRQQPDSDCWL